MDTSFYGQLVVTGITVGAIYAAAALGFVLIFRVTGILNFAQGEFLMVGAMLIISLRADHWPLIVAIPVTVAIVFVLGCVIYAVAIYPSIKRATHISLLLITLGVSQILQGAASLIWGENIRFAQPFSPRKAPFKFHGVTITTQSLWIIGGVLIAVAVIWLLLERTGTGRALRACSADPMMARLVGIDVRRIAMLSFGASAGVGALAGLLLAPSIGTSYDAGSNLAIKGIAAAVLGGFGSFPGAVVGGVALGLLEAFGSHVSSGLQTGIAMSVVLAVLLVFPSGLVGRRQSSSPRGA
jgi:branched-chain amino acid transport system permease protein